MRVISQNGLQHEMDLPYEEISIERDKNVITAGYSSVLQRSVVGTVIAKYSTEEKGKRAMEMLHNAYVGIIKGLNVDISADTTEKIHEMMKTGYGMLIAKESNNGDRLEFYPMNTVFRFPTDEELE